MIISFILMTYMFDQVADVSKTLNLKVIEDFGVTDAIKRFIIDIARILYRKRWK